MAKGRGSRGPTRMDLRRQAEAAEARDDEEKEDDGAEAEEEVEEPEAEEAEAGDDDDDEVGKKKKKKAPAKKKTATAKKPATKRVRATKEVRHRAVWVVFDNSSKRIGTFDFSKKADAEALLASKQEEKKGTFYINLVKDELKDEAK